jgi:cyclic pyranopterin phosphate synthase
MDSINAADTIGLKVKINTVIIRGWNEDEIVDFAEFARNSGHIVRFIEFMPLDGSGIRQSDLVFSRLTSDGKLLTCLFEKPGV